MSTTEKTWESCAEVAVRVRGALKRNFPTVKFSVRSHNYSGGSSVRVSWTDGPTTAQVEQHINTFEGVTFDGMTDCKGYQPVVVVGEEGPREVANSSWVMTSRHISDWEARDAEAQAYVTAHFAAGTEWHVLDRYARLMVNGRDYRTPETLEAAFERALKG